MNCPKSAQKHTQISVGIKGNEKVEKLVRTDLITINVRHTKMPLKNGNKGGEYKDRVITGPGLRFSKKTTYI